MKKRFLALTLSMAMMIGTMPAALAEESVTVQDSVTAAEVSSQMGTLTGKIDNNVDDAAMMAEDGEPAVSLQAVHNDVVAYQSNSDKTIEVGSSMKLYFKIKHRTSSKSSRVLTTIYASDGSVIADAKRTIRSDYASEVKYTLQWDTTTDMPVGEYTVQSYVEEKTDGTWNRVSSIRTFSVHLSPRCTKVTHIDTGLQVRWSTPCYLSEGTAYYPENIVIYRKAGNESKWLKVGYLDPSEYNGANDSDVSNGMKYTYSIKAICDGTYSKRSSSKTYYYLRQPSGVTVTTTGARKMKVEWKRNSKASGYQIKYSRTSDMAGSETVSVSGNKQVSKSVSGLLSGAQYYVQVRSYKTVSGKKYYSAWSEAAARHIEAS